MTRTAGLALLLLASGCATTSGRGETSPDPGFQPLGEYERDGLRAFSVAFDADSVRGAKTHVTRRDDGTWAGFANGRAVDMRVQDGQFVIQSSRGLMRVRVTELPEGGYFFETASFGRGMKVVEASECTPERCQNAAVWRATTANRQVPLEPLIIAVVSHWL